MTDKDYGLLRPFDLEAVKRGEAIIDTDGDSVTYIAGPSLMGEICVDLGRTGFALAAYSDLRMAPLCWVEGRPVYRGDVLYHHILDAQGRYKFFAEEMDGEKLCLKSDPEGYAVASPDRLTWTPPKVKREGWVNTYPSVDDAHSALVSNACNTKLDQLRREGFAVVVFNPEELQGADPSQVEDLMVSRGWDAIETLKEVESEGGHHD